MNRAVLDRAVLGCANISVADVGNVGVLGVMGVHDDKKETFYILDTKGRRIVDVNKVRMVYK